MLVPPSPLCALFTNNKSHPFHHHLLPLSSDMLDSSWSLCRSYCLPLICCRGSLVVSVFVESFRPKAGFRVSLSICRLSTSSVSRLIEYRVPVLSRTSRVPSIGCRCLWKTFISVSAVQRKAVPVPLSNDQAAAEGRPRLVCDSYSIVLGMI